MIFKINDNAAVQKLCDAYRKLVSCMRSRGKHTLQKFINCIKAKTVLLKANKQKGGNKKSKKIKRLKCLSMELYELCSSECLCYGCYFVISTFRLKIQVFHRLF